MKLPQKHDGRAEARKATAMAISTLTNIEEEPRIVSLI